MTTSCLRTREPLQVGERHVRTVRVGAFHDQLGGGLAGGGEEQLVLHLGEKNVGFFFRDAVVRAQGKEVADFLIKALFRGPDLADARQQFVEIVPGARILEPLIVHDEALHQIFLQVSGGPLAELDAAWRADAVADGENQRPDGRAGCGSSCHRRQLSRNP